MKIKFYLILLIAVVVIQTGFTQSYIVNYEQDTLAGIIKGRVDLSKQILFKPEGQTDFQVYTTEDIQEFYVEGSLYKARKVPTEQNRTLFLVCLVEGKLNLYQYKNTYFVAKAGDVLIELEKKEMYTANYHKEDKRYIGILRYLTADCTSLQDKIDHTKYGGNSFIKLITTYNHCAVSDHTTKTYDKSFQLKVQKGIKAGLVVSDMVYPSSGGRYYECNFQTKTGYTAGVFLNLFYKERTSFQPEILITQKGASVRKISSNVYVDDEYADFSFTYLQIPIHFYYTFPAKKIRPFVGAGGIFGYALAKNAYRETKRRSSIEVDKDEYGYRGSLGLSFALSPKQILKLEYVYEKTLTNKRHVMQKIHHITQHLTLSTSF